MKKFFVGAGVVVGLLAVIGIAYFLGKSGFGTKKQTAPPPAPSYVKILTSNSQDLAIEAVTPKIVRESVLNSGTAPVLQFRGKGFNSGMAIIMYNNAYAPTKQFALNPIVENPTDPSDPSKGYRIAKATLYQKLEIGLWSVQPQLGVTIGDMLPDAFEVAADTAVTISSVDPATIPGNYKSGQMVIAIRGTGFDPNAVVFINGLKLTDGTIASRPTLLTVKGLKFDSGQRLTMGIHELKVVNPDGSQATTMITVGTAVKSKPLPKKNSVGSVGKIVLRIILFVGCIVALVFFWWKAVPWIVGRFDPANNPDLDPVDVEAGSTDWLKWSIRIAGIGFFAFLAFLIGLPIAWFLEILGLMFFVGIIFALFASKGHNWVTTMRAMVHNPVLLITLLLYVIFIIMQLAGWLNA